MTESVAPEVTDPEIAAERAYLADARAALRVMHSDVVTMETPENDGEDTDEVWHNTVYRLARARRAQALIDFPDVPLFFGRLDYPLGTVYDADPEADSSAARKPEADRVYIGRRHVHDAVGTPMVIDWRADISTAFYRATRADPLGVRLRRRYGFSDSAELTAYEDEPLVGADAAIPAGSTDAMLIAEIERPRSGPMRDIVATIQPEQDDLVRAPLHPTLCIQGAPGTGKTAVGLHRIAYLLYSERDRLGRDGGVAVVGPNRSFLTYIRRVLPALGEVDVRQTTVEQLIGRTAVPRDEDPSVARIKGDARMAAVLREALWRHLGEPTEDLVYTRGSSRYRIPARGIARLVADLRGTTRYTAGRSALAQRLAHFVLRQMEQRGAAPDDRDQNAVARSRPVKQAVDQVWPKLTPEQVLHRLLSDAGFLAVAAEGQFTSEEQALLVWPKPPRSWRSAKWSPADAVLLDDLADLFERTSSLSHLVVDEAQDLSPMQCRALARRCTTGALTVLGDIAQGTSPWAAGDWPALLAHLGKPDARVAVLDRGFRVPAQIIDYAARLLPEIAPGLTPPTSVRHATGSLRLTEATDTDLLDRLVDASRDDLAGTGTGSVAVIAADAAIGPIHQRLRADGLDAALLGGTDDALESARLVCVPATLAKGLEFDAVVVAEPAQIVAAEPRGTQRLYVVLTRAVTSLHIVHAAPLPAALRPR